MALEPVQLDDLKWTDMMSAIRARIPAASKGLWTLHAPVDPGITLLELFAWLLEQRGYWLDQAPDSLVRALLTLLGESPRPVSLAGTVLALRREPAIAVQVLADPVEAEPDGPGQPPVFTSDAGLTVLPVARLQVRAGAEDLTADVEQGRNPEILRAGRDEVRITLHLAENITGRSFDQPCSLLFELETPAQIPPEWSPQAVSGVFPPADLQWLYPSSSGDLKSFVSVEDGTVGMRRSSVVRLPIPGDWYADHAADPITGLTPYSIVLRARTASFTAPPRLSALEVNALLARHQRLTEEHLLRVEWLPLPDCRLVLPEQDRPPIEETIAVQLLDRDGKWHEWKPVSDFCFCGPSDRVFLTDRDAGWLRFGNGLTGRVPVLSTNIDPNVRLRYRVGGGPAGNLGRARRWRLAAHPAITGRNPVPAIGGEEAETLSEARVRLAASLWRTERAVTQKDHETIAATTEGIALARAHAAVGYHPCYPCATVPGAVTVFVAPEAPRAEKDETEDFTFVLAPQPDTGALDLVRRRMEKARLVGSEVFVLGPRYHAVALRLQLDGESAGAARLRERLWRGLRDYLDPLTGGDDGEGWPFGASLYPSELQKAAQRVLGAEGEVSGVAIRLDGAGAFEDCKKTEIGPHDLVYLESLSVEWTQVPPEQGGLQ